MIISFNVTEFKNSKLCSVTFMSFVIASTSVTVVVWYVIGGMVVPIVAGTTGDPTPRVARSGNRDASNVLPCTIFAGGLGATDRNHSL